MKICCMPNYGPFSVTAVHRRCNEPCAALSPLSQREGPPLMRRPSADAVAGNGRPLNWAPSAHAVAGESLAFWSGWLALGVALVSPVHALGAVLFSAHMIQHEVLMLVAAPLLVLGRPLPL